MPYYAYNAPTCGYCGQEQGIQEVNGGRQRLYCSDKCRKAAQRKRDKEKSRNRILTYNSELRDYWQDYRIDGELLLILQEILVLHGKDAAKAATDAVIFALVADRREGLPAARF